jgi:glycoside/pentoside/hexuronide:cation symporter, GPH family
MTAITTESVPVAASEAPSPAGRLIAFSTASIPVNAAQVPLAVYLAPIYARHYGLSLAALGTIFLLERLWGAVADPLIGVLSDRGRSRFGRRKPWIVAGGLVFALAGIPLFFPPEGVSPLQVGIVLFAFYLGWSMIQIPYLAWSGELSGDYHQRTRIVSYQTAVGAIALLVVLVVPTIVDQLRPGDDALKLGSMGAVILASIPVGILLTVLAFPEPPLPAKPAARLPLATSLRLIARETLLLRVLASDFAVSVAQTIRGGLFVFFVSQVAMAPQMASGLFLLQFLFGIAAGPIWMWAGYRLGKHRAAVTGELIQVMINLGLLLVAPGMLPLIAGLTIAQGLAQGSGNQMLRAIVADVADKHRLETGRDRAALFFSVFSLSSKAGMAVGIGIALPLVGWLGFDPRIANARDALLGLQLVFALGPALAHILAAWLVYNFPLDERAHDRIRRQLDAGEPIVAEIPPVP